MRNRRSKSSARESDVVMLGARLADVIRGVMGIDSEEGQRVASLLAIAYDMLADIEVEPAKGPHGVDLARFARDDDDEADEPPGHDGRRDLKRDMAGPLPSLQSNHAPVVAPFREVPAPDSNNPDIYIGEPTDVCPGCKQSVETHPIDENMPPEGEMWPHVMCDQSRVYSWTSRRKPAPRPPSANGESRRRKRRP